MFVHKGKKSHLRVVTPTEMYIVDLGTEGEKNKWVQLGTRHSELYLTNKLLPFDRKSFYV